MNEAEERYTRQLAQEHLARVAEALGRQPVAVMTVRQWLIGQALTGIIAGCSREDWDTETAVSMAARVATLALRKMAEEE